MWCVPVACDDKEDSALLIEAFASHAYRELAPFFYEEQMKIRYSDSAMGAQMFDIIRESVYSDFGRVCQFAGLDILESAFRYCFYYQNKQVYSTDYVSKLELKLGTQLIAFPELLNSYAKYKDR